MTEFLAVILGGGAAAMVTAIVQAYRSIKDGSRVAEKDAVADLEKWRSTSDSRRALAERKYDYWRSVAGSMEYVIRSRLGDEAMPPRGPEPKDDEEDDGDPA